MSESYHASYIRKFIYKPAIFDEKQLHIKQDQLRSHKSAVYPRTATMLQHLLLLAEAKGSCAHVLLMITGLYYSYSLVYSYAYILGV